MEEWKRNKKILILLQSSSWVSGNCSLFNRILYLLNSLVVHCLHVMCNNFEITKIHELYQHSDMVLKWIGVDITRRLLLNTYVDNWKPVKTSFCSVPGGNVLLKTGHANGRILSVLMNSWFFKISQNFSELNFPWWKQKHICLYNKKWLNLVLRIFNLISSKQRAHFSVA